MKKTLKLAPALLIIICIATLLLLVGCGNTPVSDAYITNSNLPRTNYVEGQDFDFSKGYLTIVRDGEESNIPFNAEGLTVSGYDKTKTGIQTVTVTYGEASTTISVTVLPRITAENFETKYFVGDTFDKSKGRLKIADDNAKIQNVNMSDAKVSLVSFDSASAGVKTITVRYTNGSVSYDYSFDVTVYEAASIVPTLPTKTNYNSHQDTILDKDVKDGYLTVTSSDGSLVKIVPITANMIKGYDPSVATIANQKTPVNQTVKIEYLNYNYDYEIKIFFSGVSVVNYYANGILKGIDLSGSLTAEQSEAAYFAASELLALSPTDKSALSEEIINTVVAAATVGVSEMFMKELEKHQYAFAMDEAGQLFLVGYNYAATSNALRDLHNLTSPINSYVSILREFKDEYSSVDVTSTEKVGDIIIVYSPEMENLLIPILEHLVSVHELISNVPDEWTNETLKQKGSYIIDAIIEIKRSEYGKNGLGTFYTDVLSKWRTKDDFLQVIYSYFLYVYEDDGSFMQNNMFGYLPLPGTLQDLYEQIMTTYDMQYNLYTYKNTDMWMADLSTYVTSYFLTWDYANAIKSSGNQFLIDIYNKYTMDYIIASYTGAQNFGFLNHAGAMVDSDIFMTLWQQYYGVLQLYLTKNLDAVKHQELITTMVTTFQNMNPNEVFGFLSSLNLDYGNSRGALPVLVLDFEGHEEENIFSTILREYYCTYLTEANVPIFAKLLMAMENAALFGENEYVLSNFVGIMEELNGAVKNLTDENDIKNFEKYIDKTYNRYLNLYNNIMGQYDGKLTEDELALFTKLKTEIANFEKVYMYIIGLTESEYTEAHEFLLYSAFAKAATTYNTLLSLASDAALTRLFTEGCTFLEMDMTVAKAFYQIDLTTTMILQGAASAYEKDGTYVLISHWDALADYGLLEIYADFYDLLYYALVDDKTTVDEGALKALSSKVALLPEFNAGLFSSFGGASAYYTAKCTYLVNAFVGDTAALAIITPLSQAANAYANYRMNPYDSSNLANFTAAMEEVAEIYGGLSDEIKNTVKEIYDYYTEINNELSKTV